MNGIVSSVDVSKNIYDMKDSAARADINLLKEKIKELTNTVNELLAYIKALDPDGNKKVVNTINGQDGNVTLDIQSLGGVPTNHADVSNQYGIGSQDKYGHVKVTDVFTNVVNTKNEQGVAASAYGLQASYKDLKEYVSNNLGVTSFNGEKGDITFGVENLDAAPINHAAISKRYGAGTNEQYGHVMLSDIYDNTSASQKYDGAEASKGASSYALQQAYQNLKQEIQNNNKGVTSVNEKTGDVSLTYEDLNAAPKVHATFTTTYGGGDNINYGHVKVSDAYSGSAEDSARANNSIVPSLYAIQKVNQKTDINNTNIKSLQEKITSLESNPITITDIYDVNTPDKTTSGADARVAASAYAVQETYKKAKTNTQNLTDLTKKVSTLQDKINEGNHRTLTQKEYDSLSFDEKNNGTIYFVTDGFNGYLASDIYYVPVEGASVQDDNVQSALESITKKIDEFSVNAEDIVFTPLPESTIVSTNVQGAINELNTIILENNPEGKVDINQGIENYGCILQVNSYGQLALKNLKDIGLGSSVSANPIQEEGEVFLPLSTISIDGLKYEIDSGSGVEVSDTEPTDEKIVLWINTSKNYGE